MSYARIVVWCGKKVRCFELKKERWTKTRWCGGNESVQNLCNASQWLDCVFARLRIDRCAGFRLRWCGGSKLVSSGVCRQFSSIEVINRVHFMDDVMYICACQWWRMARQQSAAFSHHHHHLTTLPSSQPPQSPFSLFTEITIKPK